MSQIIAASQSLFIKLGEKGDWEKDCIEGSNPCIRLGYRSQQHRECLANNWDAVWQYWRTTGDKTEGKATEAMNQVKYFYTEDEQTLWITFYKRKLWWCFASQQVEEWPDGSRARKTLGPWSCKDRLGNDLDVDGLHGELTKVRGFRGTICKVNQADYLVDRINGICPEEVRKAKECLVQFESAIEKLIHRLGWKDFELLCDLIFTRAGWQRISSLGKEEKTIDMKLLSPLSDRRAVVQVKSQADLETFLEYKQRFEEMSGYDEAYFVVHKPSPDLVSYQTDSSLFLLTADRLAKRVVTSGLSEWLIKKTS